MNRENLNINEKNFMVDCIATATLIIDNNIKHPACRDLEKREKLIVKMAIAFYQKGE